MTLLLTNKIVVGINAYNIRAGGGITHLSEILNHLEFNNFSFKEVVLWAPKYTLDKIEEKPWLIKINTESVANPFFSRYWWVLFNSNFELRKYNIDILLVPGGTYLGKFKPFVAINQNLLPFESKEIKRYGVSLNYFKFYFLRFLQTFTYHNASGIIFLSKYSRGRVFNLTKILSKKSVVIPHGVNFKFNYNPSLRIFRKTSEFSSSSPCRILYISSVEVYKHQWTVIDAIEQLNKEGLFIKLTLAGPPGSGSKKLIKKLKSSNNELVEYIGSVTYKTIEKLYKEAEIGVFASSCETFGMILTEAMYCSLPLAASNMSAIPDVLSDAGLYFNPEDKEDIASGIRKLYGNPELRQLLSIKGYERVQKFDWGKSANDTFSFVEQIFLNNKI